jgi:tetratricopeptide (TPR) repeat protein
LLWDKQQQTEVALKQAQTQKEEADRRRLMAETNFQRACVLLHNSPLKEQLSWLPSSYMSRAVARETHEKALATFQTLLTEPGPDPADRLLTATVHEELGNINVSAGRRAEAAQEYQKAIVLLHQLVAEFPPEVGIRHSLAHCFKQLGWLNLTGARPEERAEDYMQAITLYEELGKEFRDAPWYRFQIATCWGELGELRRRNGQFQQGEEAFRRALPLYERLFEEFPQSPQLRDRWAGTHNNLAWVLAIRPDWNRPSAAEGLEHAQKAVDLQPESDDRWHTLGVAHWRLGHWKQTLECLKKSRQLEISPGPSSSFQLFFEAMAYSGLGDRDKARRCYDEGVQWREKHLPDHADLRRFQAEAAHMLGIQDSKKTEAKAPIP